MKKLIILSIICFVTIHANAGDSLNAHLTQMHFETNSELSNSNFIDGKINIDFTNSKVALTFFNKVDCPKNAMCIMPVMVTATSIQAILTNIDTNKCGVTTYLAKNDNLQVNGNFTEIKIVDYSQNVCPVLTDEIMSPTKITLKMEHIYRPELDPINKKAIHNFYGDFLR